MSWDFLVSSCRSSPPCSPECLHWKKQQKGEGLEDSRAVHIPVMENNQNSDEREKSLLMMSSDCHIFFIFYYHVVQENVVEADRMEVDSKLEISAPVVSGPPALALRGSPRFHRGWGWRGGWTPLVFGALCTDQCLEETRTHQRGSATGRSLAHGPGSTPRPERSSRLSGGCTSLEGAPLFRFCFAFSVGHRALLLREFCVLLICCT